MIKDDKTPHPALVLKRTRGSEQIDIIDKFLRMGDAFRPTLRRARWKDQGNFDHVPFDEFVLPDCPWVQSSPNEADSHPASMLEF